MTTVRVFEENMIRLPIAEGWSTFSVDVTDKLKRLQGPDDYLSLLIVPNAARPTTMRIRNARLRACTEKEREQARLKKPSGSGARNSSMPTSRSI